MTRTTRTPRAHAPRVTRIALVAAVVVAGLALGACTKKNKDSATQAAAKVNGTEITVHQINYVLQRERGVRPENLDAASRQALERLIDLQLVVQKAESQKLDKDPEAKQAMDAARREVLARAYGEQLAQSVPAATDEVLKKFYDDNDMLFAHRKVITATDFAAKVPADKIPALKAKVDAGAGKADIEAWFKAADIVPRTSSGPRSPEQMPPQMALALTQAKVGTGRMESSGEQVRIMFVDSVQEQPVTFEQAKPRIAMMMGGDSRRKSVEASFQALKTASKIEYFGPYASLAASSPALPTSRDIMARQQFTPASGGARIELPAASAAPGAQVTLPGAAASATHVDVSLPPATPATRVNVQLPASAGAAGVQVHLPDAPASGAHR